MDELSEGSGESFLNADELDAPAIAADSARQPTQEDRSDGQPPRDTMEQMLNTIEKDGNSSQTAPQLPQRPILRRDASAPKQESVPSQQIPMANPRDVAELGPSADSLSLGQLKKIVEQMPNKYEPTPYAFEYQDYSSFPEELDELFTYSVQERESLRSAKVTFLNRWSSFCNSKVPANLATPDGADWDKTTRSDKVEFLQAQKHGIKTGDGIERTQSLECILVVALGVWPQTAGLIDRAYMSKLEQEALAGDETESARHEMATELKKRYKRSSAQLAAILDNMQTVVAIIGAQEIYNVFREAYTKTSVGHGDPMMATQENRLDPRQFWMCSILLYLIVDLAVRSEGTQEGGKVFRSAVMTLEPNLLQFLTNLVADMRWNDAETTPAIKVFLLYWKTFMVVFGTLSEAGAVKDRLKGDDRTSAGSTREPTITASPLDYHIFRQEITSKYPAFDPPKPLFPFDPENTSLVPPLQDQDHRPSVQESNVGPVAITNTSSSILHQPVHIATPAPSPPPSPAGPGGKGIKKQNYQTNQMFPFLYPPLESDSNSIGGKGSTELQDALVGREWTGSDVPTSILEAAELFAGRMRATRPMKQLWKERVRFMKHERGYDINDFRQDDDSREEGSTQQRKSEDEEESQADFQKLDEDMRRRMQAVEDFYQTNLPQLQSVVIVWMKVILQAVTALITQPNAPNGLQTGLNTDGNGNSISQEMNGREGSDEEEEPVDPILRDLDTMRCQEILSKAVTGSMILLLKWLKVSHVLKFEYLTQLILDSNYIQLLLKLFTHQEPERVVNYRCEQRSTNFLRVCISQSRSSEVERGGGPSAFSDTASDSSAPSSPAAPPPPIRASRPSGTLPDSDIPDFPQPPEVDELGYMTSEIPSSPITTFSWRNFYTLINHVRILQKIAKGKPHRQLLMVQYKYASVLRKNLKVPQSAVRLYTLKAIKGQVPYSHRKWRQGNMRIITAIYLHCQPELRDEWLAGVDVDQEMVEALPQERALRSLTYWHNLKRYPNAMGRGPESRSGAGLEEQEQDFFVGELEKMDYVIRKRGGMTDYEELEEEAAAQEEQRLAQSAQSEGFLT